MGILYSNFARTNTLSSKVVVFFFFFPPQGIIKVRDNKEFLGHLTLSLTIFYSYEYVLSSFIYCWSVCERISLVHITENPWVGSGQKSV